MIRRHFLGLVVGITAGACSRNQSDQKGFSMPSCDDLSGLTEADLDMRASLSYVSRITIPGTIVQQLSVLDFQFRFKLLRWLCNLKRAYSCPGVLFLLGSHFVDPARPKGPRFAPHHDIQEPLPLSPTSHSNTPPSLVGF